MRKGHSKQNFRRFFNTFSLNFKNLRRSDPVLLLALLPALAAAHGEGGEVTVIIINPLAFPYAYGRPQPPVALPERGALYSTGMIGNYSAVPYPPSRPFGSRPEPAQGEEAGRQHDGRENARAVIRLEDQRRRVRSLDAWER